MKPIFSLVSVMSLLFVSCGQEAHVSSSVLATTEKESVAFVCKTSEDPGAIAFQAEFDMKFQGGKVPFVWGQMAPAKPWPIFQPLLGLKSATVERLDLESAFQTQFTFLNMPKTTSDENVKTLKLVATMTMQAPFNRGSAVLYADIEGKSEELNFTSCKFVRVLHQ